MACPNCNKTVYTNQKSNIGLPDCQPNCPEQVDCDGNVTLSDCIAVNVDLTCAETVAGDSLSTVLTAIDEKLCESTGNCTVSVTADDTCCGYLSDKLTSDNQSILIEVLTDEPSGCQKINIETKPASIVWNNINLTSSFETISGYQIPQYSEPDTLGRVWFRGSFTCKSGIYLNPGSVTTANTSALRVQYRPLANRSTFNGMVAASTGGASQVPRINIFTNGIIQVKNTTNNILDSRGIICLDGFVIETLS